MNLDMGKLEDSIRRHEGIRLVAYQDTLGVWTIGYGCTMYRCGPARGQKVRMGDRITEIGAEAELQVAIRDSMDEVASRIEGIEDLPEPAQRALTELCYQLGINRLLRFRRMLAAIEKRHWTRAAAEAIDSKWHTQTPKRVLHVVELFAEAAGE